jgi:Rieske Fe-S protein
MADDDSAPDPPRRDFLNLAITGTATTLGVLGAYPLIRFLGSAEPPSSRGSQAGAADTFPRGSAKAIAVGERPALVIRMEDGTFRAFVALCSHLHCVVHYAPERKRIECPCHRGVFSLEGENVAGPPPKPLEPLRVDVVDGIVTVSEV